MAITLTTPIEITDLKGATTTVVNVYVADFYVNSSGGVSAALKDVVTNTLVGNITFLAVSQANTIRAQIETYAVNNGLVVGTKI